MKDVNLLHCYTELIAENMAKSANSFFLGDPKYHNKRVTRYLYIPIPIITKHYDTDYEYGDGEFEGYLFSVKWINTHIPIGKKTIEVAIYKKPKGKVVTFSRYSPLENKKQKERRGK